MNMQKYFLLGTLIAIMPNYVFGESARYNQLVAEKQRKMEELEKCSGDVNGWKIAGISTIGLTAVGVAGNIVLANKQSKYDDKIANTQSQINDTNDKISAKYAENSAKNAPVVPVQNPQSDKNKDNESKGGYLNSDVNGTGYSADKGLLEWTVNFPYGEVHGKALCFANDGQTSGAVSPSKSELGGNCWCKLIDPEKPNWVFIESFGILNSCKDKCADACAVAIKDKQDIRMKIFDSNPIQTSNTESMAPITSSTPGEQRSDCGNVGQKECGSFNYKVCEKDGQTKECTGDMLPRNATAGHCVSAGRKGYKICTATECDDRHDLSNGHCNTEKRSNKFDPDINGTDISYNKATSPMKQNTFNGVDNSGMQKSDNTVTEKSINSKDIVQSVYDKHVPKWPWTVTADNGEVIQGFAKCEGSYVEHCYCQAYDVNGKTVSNAPWVAVPDRPKCDKKYCVSDCENKTAHTKSFRKKLYSM